MKIEELKTYKKILILGYGVEGKATERFLKKFHPACQIVIADANDGPRYLEKQNDVDLVIKTPSLQPRLITKSYTTATNIFFANVDRTKTIGITGTKGKSTTAALLNHILSLAGKKTVLLGNIGTPMLDALTNEQDLDTLFIIELSSYQLSDIHYSPHIAVVLNIYPEHQNYHENFQEYLLAKLNSGAFQEKNDYFIYNPAFSSFEDYSKKSVATTIPIVASLPFAVSSNVLVGAHNEANIRTAYTISHLLDVSDEIFKDAVSTFPGLPHRLKPIGTHENIMFIDDSASSNPHSTAFAIDTIANIGSLILGGQDRGYDFSDICTVAATKKIPVLILFPETNEKIMTELKRAQFDGIILEAYSMQEAVGMAFDHTPQGSVCLLSPGAPSYNMFENFSHRGNEFVYYVNEHATKKGDSLHEKTSTS